MNAHGKIGPDRPLGYPFVEAAIGICLALAVVGFLKLLQPGEGTAFAPPAAAIAVPAVTHARADPESLRRSTAGSSVAASSAVERRDDARGCESDHGAAADCNAQ